MRIVYPFTKLKGSFNTWKSPINGVWTCTINGYNVIIMAEKDGFSTGTVDDLDVITTTSWYGKHFKTLTQIMRIQERIYSEQPYKRQYVDWDAVYKRISRRVRL